MAENAQFGAFVSTTDVFDINTNDFSTDSDDLKLLLVRIRQTLNNVALVLNIKDSGYYLPAEFVNGQLYFPNPDVAITNPSNQNATYRQVYRMLVDFGQLPNAGAKSVPHTIPDVSEEFTFTRMYGAATDPIGLNYVAIPNGDILLRADATNVTITTLTDLRAYTRTLIVLEYIKS